MVTSFIIRFFDKILAFCLNYSIYCPLGKTYTVLAACQHGFCTPQPFTEKTNSCKVLCGADPCNQPPACNWPWIGDGWCDQVNMKAACKFDGKFNYLFFQ